MQLRAHRREATEVRLGRSWGHLSPIWLGSALGAVAFGLGFYRLGTKSIWLDEAVSIGYARSDLRSLIHTLTGGDPNMGLYYAALSGWVRIFGADVLAVRSLSVVFAALSVPVVYLIGTRLFRRSTGAIAALVLAVNEYFVRYAQEARSYSLVVLLVALSSYFFVVEMQEPSKWSWTGYVVAAALGIYAHYFAAFVLLAQLLTLLARRRALLTRRWLAAAASILVLCIPEAVAAVRHGSNGISWIPKPTVQALAETLRSLAGGSSTLIVVYLIAGSYAAVLAARTSMRWRFGYVAAWFGVPIATSFAASFVHPIFVSYYLIVSLPALALLAAIGISHIPNTHAPAVALLLLIALSSQRLANWYQANSQEDWRDAARYVTADARTGGIVFYPNYASVPFYYYERRRVTGARNLDPSGRLEWQPRGLIWLVIRSSDAARNSSGLRLLEHALGRRYQEVGRHAFPGVVVRLLRHRPAGT